MYAHLKIELFDYELYPLVIILRPLFIRLFELGIVSVSIKQPLCSVHILKVIRISFMGACQIASITGQIFHVNRKRMRILHVHIRLTLAEYGK